MEFHDLFVFFIPMCEGVRVLEGAGGVPANLTLIPEKGGLLI